MYKIGCIIDHSRIDDFKKISKYGFGNEYITRTYLTSHANNTRKHVNCNGNETHEQYSRLNPYLVASSGMQSQSNHEIKAVLFMLVIIC